MRNEPELRLIGLSKTFPGRKGVPEVRALEDISLQLHRGELACLVGPSGCGKTTLLRIAAGLERPSEGKVLLGEEEVSFPGGQVGLVFQQSALFPWRTALRNVSFGLEMRRGRDRRWAEEEARDFLYTVGMEGFERRYPRELSGGMQQRVAIARSLAVRPRVLLLDEPFGSLDAQSRNSLQEFLVELWGRTGLTMLFVTHNVDEAVFLGERVFAMTPRPGRLHRVYEVGLGYPRDRTSPAFVEIRREILSYLSQVEKAPGGGS